MADDSKKLLAALGYPIGIIALILAIVDKKEDKYVRFHAFNALFFNIGVIVIWLALFFVSMILTMITFGIFAFLAMFLYTLLWIAFLVVAILYALKAYKGEEVKIPFITDLVMKHVSGL